MNNKKIAVLMTILTLIPLISGGIFVYKLINNNTNNNIPAGPEETSYLEAKDLLKEAEVSYSFYSEEIIKALNLLNNIKDYKDSKNILVEKYNQFKKEIDAQKQINSINKEYDIEYLIDFIETINIDEEHNKEKKEYLCSFAKQAYGEGFVSSYYINLLNNKCNEFNKDEKYNNIYILTHNNWSLDIQEDKDTLKSYFIEFDADEISIQEEIISANSLPPTIKKDKYKILDNIIYIKEDNEYKKLYTITEITQDSLKFEEFDHSFDKM